MSIITSDFFNLHGSLLELEKGDLFKQYCLTALFIALLLKLNSIHIWRLVIIPLSSSFIISFFSK